MALDPVIVHLVPFRQGQQRFPQVHGEILNISQINLHRPEDGIHKQQQGNAGDTLVPVPGIGVFIHR